MADAMQGYCRTVTVTLASVDRKWVELVNPAGETLHDIAAAEPGVQRIRKVGVETFPSRIQLGRDTEPTRGQLRCIVGLPASASMCAQTKTPARHGWNRTGSLCRPPPRRSCMLTPVEFAG